LQNWEQFQICSVFIHPVVYRILKAKINNNNNLHFDWGLLHGFLFWGKHFVNPHFSARSCDGGDVVGISFDRAIQGLHLDIAGDAIRSFVTANAIWHNGLKIMFDDGQQSGTHICRNALPIDLINALDHGICAIICKLDN
jgi:hypothetical protein